MDRTQQIKKYMQQIQKNQEMNKNAGTSAYAAIEENIEEIQSLLDEFKAIATEKEFIENKTQVTKMSVEHIPVDVLTDIFGTYVSDILSNKKHYSQQVAKINQSLKHHKIAVISSKKDDFRLIFND
jgi:uncharacterized FAD-dependent dehydrogenase